MLGRWAAARYPARAVPYIVSALKRSELINHRGRWHLEYWLHKEIGREWGDYAFHEFLETKAILGYAPKQAAE